MAQRRPLPEDSEDVALLTGSPSPPPEEVVRTSFGTSPSVPSEQGFISGRDIWKQFEVHRRTAEYYLDQYLDQLDRISDVSITESDNLDSTQEIAARGTQGVNRDMIRLKISSDTAIRDILAMERILQFVLELPPPETHVVLAVVGLWTAACSVSALVVPSTSFSGISASGAIAGGIAMIAPPVRNAIQERGLRDIEFRLEKIRKAFQQRTIGMKNKDELKREHFVTLERATNRR